MVYNDKYKFVAIVNEKIEVVKALNAIAHEHNYFGILAFGKIEKINPITKRFSLWR